MVRVRFIFANWDNALRPVELDIDESMRVHAVKERLVALWPAGYEPAGDLKRIRLICMGQEWQDGSSLRDCHLPAYDYPTPVHVARIASGKPPGATAPARTAAPPKGSYQQEGNAAGAGAANAPRSDDTGCCCTIM